MADSDWETIAVGPSVASSSDEWETIAVGPDVEPLAPQGYGELIGKSAAKGLASIPQGIGYLGALIGDKATDLYNRYTDPFGMRNIKTQADAEEAVRTGKLPESSSTYLRDSGTPAIIASEDLRKRLVGEPLPQGFNQEVVSKIAEYAPGALIPGGTIPSRIGSAVGAGIGAASANAIGLPEWAGAIPGGLAVAGLQTGNSALTAATTAGKERTAKEAAKSILAETVDAPSVLAALEKNAAQEAKTPWIVRQGDNYLPQYKRTAELSGDINSAALEEAMARVEPYTKEAIGVQDANRELARARIFANENKNPMLDSTAGDKIRTAIEENRAVVKGKVKESADAAFLGDSSVSTIPSKRLISGYVNEYLADGSKKLSKDFLDLVGEFQALPKDAPLKTLQNFRSSFGDYSNVNFSSGQVDKWTSRLAGKISSSIEDQIDQAVKKGNLSPTQKKAWDSMREARKYQGATFESKAVGDVIEKSPYGAGYELAAEKIPAKLLSTRESARQAIEALSGKQGGKEALRSSLLSNLWEGSTNSATNEINLASFNRGLRNIEEVAPEVLTPSTRKALKLISEDKAANISIKDKAFRASKRNSVTSESESMIRYIENAIDQKATTSTREIIKKTPIVGEWLDVLASKVSDPEARKILIKKELSKFVLNPLHAREMLKSPSMVPQSILKLFGQRVIQSAATIGALGVASEAASEEPKKSAPKTESEKISYLIEEAQNEMDGVPPPEKPSAIENLVRAVSLQESSGNPNAIHPMTSRGERAQGLMGILPSTSKEIAKELGVKKYDLKDPETNMRFGKHYLEKLIDMFDGRTDLALTAYHSGPGRVKNLLKLHNATTLQEILPYLGPQGRAYASGVMSKLKKIEKNGVFEV